jgi:GNAT superfamily N-acetyltransferase
VTEAPDIGFAAADDMPALVALLGELFSREADFQPDPEKQRRALDYLVAHPEAGRLFVLREAGRAIGMANALFTVSTAEGGPVLMLEDVIVAAHARGRGLGRQLIAHVLQWARTEGFLRVTLLTDGANAGAQRFYRACGFSRSGMAVYRLGLRSPPRS